MICVVRVHFSENYIFFPNIIIHIHINNCFTLALRVYMVCLYLVRPSSVCFYLFMRLDGFQMNMIIATLCIMMLSALLSALCLYECGTSRVFPFTFAFNFYDYLFVY